ncbi:hypothetical protein BSK63_17530 [Paenibacillus odorifer]|uniref:hypothetical protein n=1 Tax=Paenibacillus odorifer TaxID=189426 RepID=UPI00096EA051|nr:hypothetical protein [Paenibacillus odorifer]OME30694.1 hypothetical protein BSK63_17530 [Paenibacillus odorifer]
MPHDNFIKELDFVLTHPSCSVENIESFYNQCLFIYETVPLFVIINHMKETKPKLLKNWSNSNKTVSKLLEDMEIQKDDLDKKRNEEILVEVEDSSLQMSQNGYYILIWNTEIEKSKIESCFKRKTLKVISKSFKNLELIGYKLEKLNQYILYLKNKGELII